MKQIKEALTFNDVLLVPSYSVIASRKDVDTSTQLTKNISLKIPIVSANMDTITEYEMAQAMDNCGGLGIIHRFMSIEEQRKQVVYVGGNRVGVAVGVTDNYLDRCKALYDEGVDVFVVDVAHAHAAHVLNAITLIRKTFSDVDIIGGNVATPEGVTDLINAGVDGVKIGIGPGAVCSTRVVTGCGVPQLSAIMECYEFSGAKDHNIPLIADGGIRNSGDIVKALAAGASCVMLGSMLAGTDETPGKTWVDHRSGREYKVYRGMASTAAMQEKNKRDVTKIDDRKTPEGVVVEAPLRGPVKNVIDQLMGGVRSGFSYCGARDLATLQKYSKFVRITHSGWEESKPVQQL